MASHVPRVRMLYRKICKELYHYSATRPVWGEFIQEARARFEANRDVTDEAKIQALIKDGEKWLIDNKCGDPYIVPTNPGGTKFQRNVPPSLEIVEKHS
mmetsp:Transcript_35625/g.66021  ORF Transcript_35625/g.66021 Transcript_35625/m.66021 type:complete len:99 (+) Transcript_35625:31-327(+)